MGCCPQWASIAGALALDETQREQLIQLRRMYLRVLGKAVRQRRQQLQLLQVRLFIAPTWSLGLPAPAQRADGLMSVGVCSQRVQCTLGTDMLTSLLQGMPYVTLGYQRNLLNRDTVSHLQN